MSVYPCPFCGRRNDRRALTCGACGRVVRSGRTRVETTAPPLPVPVTPGGPTAAAGPSGSGPTPAATPAPTPTPTRAPMPVTPRSRPRWSWLRTLGIGLSRPFTNWRSRPPAVTSELVATDLVVAERGDVPLWALLVRASVALPLLALLATFVLALALAWPVLRVMRLMSNPTRLLGHSSATSGVLGGSLARLLVAFGVGIFLGRRWRGRQLERTAVVWRLADQHGNNTVARIGLPEHHGFDVRPGDTLDLWGKRHHDGTLRTFHARNRRNSLIIQPRFVPTATWVLLAITVIAVIALI